MTSCLDFVIQIMYFLLGGASFHHTDDFFFLLPSPVGPPAMTREILPSSLYFNSSFSFSPPNVPIRLLPRFPALTMQLRFRQRISLYFF